MTSIETGVFEAMSQTPTMKTLVINIVGTKPIECLFGYVFRGDL